MSDELKPCPFCRSERVAGFTATCEDRLFREYVACENCGASTTTYETKEEAAAAWNARAERTCRNVASEKAEAGTFSVGGVFKCSYCGASYGYTEMPYPFCPWCGAKVAPC